MPKKSSILTLDAMAKLHSRLWRLLLVGLLFTPTLLVTGENDAWICVPFMQVKEGTVRSGLSLCV